MSAAGHRDAAGDAGTARAAAEVVVSPRGAARLRQGVPFVPRADVLAPPAPGDDADGADVVLVRDGRGALLGTALYAAAGPIALRALGPGALRLDGALLRERVAAALERRRTWLERSLIPGADAYRVVHGEADQLPGLFVDRYGEAAVLQTATVAMDARKGEIAAILAELLPASLVVCRDDGSARDLEGLPRERRVLLGREAAALVRFHDAGAPMEADLLAGSKTGSFLDQQENHALAGRLAAGLRGEALDTFSYQGGFALQLARAGLRVLGCDESPEAVRRARRNAELAGLPGAGPGAVEFRVKNAFDLLRELEAEGRRFAMVVIDPPALGKRGRGRPEAAGQRDAALRASNDRALRAYRELNLRGLRLLQPGGLLVTCSCSARPRPAEFEELLAEAARDAGRAAQLLCRRGAGEDHPALLGVPETEYLKCLVLRAL